ncbi:MAG: VacJ family lipoprotein [Gammaproteobacteria bacterium]
MSVSHLVKFCYTLLLGSVLFLTNGCATTKPTDEVATMDRFETANRASYNFTDSLDRNIIKPAAEAYADVTPKPVRTAVTNFFNNLTYLNVILNDFLQGKWDQGLQDSLRFLYNSTAGIGGLFDVSTAIDMPANNEDFGQTLAVWGVDRGSYLFIPFFGPNTVRDTTDFVPSTLLNPLFYASGLVLLPVTALNAVNTRANLLEASNLRDEAAIDPYVFTREAFLQQREYLVYDGNPPASEFDDIFLEEDENMLIIE